MGVDEYWLFDPSAEHIPRRIAAYRLRCGSYEPMAPLPAERGYRSEALGLELRAEGGDLRIYDPLTGEDLKHYQEEKAGRRAAEARADAEAAARRRETAARREAEERAESEAAARRALEAELERLRRRTVVPRDSA